MFFLHVLIRLVVLSFDALYKSSKFIIANYRARDDQGCLRFQKSLWDFTRARTSRNEWDFWNCWLPLRYRIIPCSINTDSLIETFKEIHRTIALSYRIDDYSRHKSCVLRRKQFALNSLEFPLYQTTPTPYSIAWTNLRRNFIQKTLQTIQSLKIASLLLKQLIAKRDSRALIRHLAVLPIILFRIDKESIEKLKPEIR